MISLQNDEKHIRTFRKHPIVLLPAIIVLLFFTIIPIILWKYLPLGITLSTTGDTAHLLTFLYVAWLTLLWLAFSVVFVDHWLDMWVVTDKRLFDFEQLGLFNRQTAVTRIDQIQDISIDVRGVFATFLRYGDIHVQTAGANKEFVLHNIANPLAVKRLLNELQNK